MRFAAFSDRHIFASNIPAHSLQASSKPEIGGNKKVNISKRTEPNSGKRPGPEPVSHFPRCIIKQASQGPSGVQWPFSFKAWN
jgi:hypothetical protein